MHLFIFVVVFLSIAPVHSLNVFRLELHKKYDKVARLLKTGQWRQAVRAAKNNTEPLVDYFDDFYNINVSVGTPPQIVSLAFDTNSARAWVIDSACDSDYCVGWTITDYDKNQFFTFNTTTIQYTGSQFSVKYSNGGEASGTVISDVFSFAGITIPRQEFGLAEKVNKEIGYAPIDGYFGAGLGSTPMAAALSQTDKQVFTLWLDRHEKLSEGSNGGQLTVGDIDTVNCDAAFNWVPLYVPGLWEFKLDSFSMSSYKDSKTVAALSSTGRSFMGIPYWAMNKIEKFTDASYDFEDNLYLVHCEKTGLPDMVFTIGAVDYHIPQSEYVLNLDMSNGMCVLAAYEIEGGGFGPTWIFGDAFARSFCQAFDVQNKKVGFSKAHHAEIPRSN